MPMLSAGWLPHCTLRIGSRRATTAVCTAVKEVRHGLVHAQALPVMRCCGTASQGFASQLKQMDAEMLVHSRAAVTMLSCRSEKFAGRAMRQPAQR